MAVANIAIGSAQAVAQASAVARSNAIARQQAGARRQFEAQQLAIEKRQAISETQTDRHSKMVEGLEARGRLQAAVAETGVGGGVVQSLYRNLNVDESSQLANIDITARHLSEATAMKSLGSALRHKFEVERLPEVPDTGLAIASSVIGGLSAGFDAGMGMGRAIGGDGTTLKDLWNG